MAGENDTDTDIWKKARKGIQKRVTAAIRNKPAFSVKDFPEGFASTWATQPVARWRARWAHNFECLNRASINQLTSVALRNLRSLSYEQKSKTGYKSVLLPLSYLLLSDCSTMGGPVDRGVGICCTGVPSAGLSRGTH